ncbi:glutathione synthase [Noviherbaspirillum pedocola]|uniref:Glutathione synthetase n=1 Tax=Noviherbaspirillum pedocola TaxID=2801341 RepID=A0A934SW38_9BURK|nr:glutathione synthase [Noviherbaspirillum pedocola]MBK4736473.1 glutathione synthase [Noviherbaspirillum pedocola]
MNIAFAADPLSGFKIYKDTTYAMMVEAARRGHTIHAFGHRDMAIEGGRVVANVSRITLTGDSSDWYRAEPPVSRHLTEFDAIVERTDPPFDMEYIYATYLLEVAQNHGAKVFNRPEAIRNHNEKLAIAQFPQLTAPTLVTSDEARIKAFHAEHRDVILKPLDGMGGAGIFRVRDDAMNLGSIIETLSNNGRRTIMAQRYIPEIVDGDKRVLLIGGEVMPYCLARIPQGGEVRGNLAAGGLGVAREITAREREIGETLAPILWKRGLLLVGLDVIGNYLTEINVTSPTCFQEIEQQTGFSVAAKFIDALEKAAFVV